MQVCHPCFQEGGQLRVVTESTTSEQGGHWAAEAGEGWWIEQRLGEVPLQSRTDHPAMVAARALPRAYRPLIRPLIGSAA